MQSVNPDPPAQKLDNKLFCLPHHTTLTRSLIHLLRLCSSVSGLFLRLCVSACLRICVAALEGFEPSVQKTGGGGYYLSDTRPQPHGAALCCNVRLVTRAPPGLLPRPDPPSWKRGLDPGDAG